MNMIQIAKTAPVPYDVTDLQWHSVEGSEIAIVSLSARAVSGRTTLSQKNDTDVAHYNFNAHQPILAIFGRDVAERVCYQMVICYLTSPN